MIVVQISDTHVEEPGRLAYGRVDTAAALRAAVACINAMVPRPDLVLHTGDLAHHGSAARYALFRELVRDLAVPFCAIPGNHDDRAPFREAFADTSWMPREGTFLHHVAEAGALRVVCCDTVIPGEVPGALCAERLAWLDARLAEAPGRPTIVAMHHPPFGSGMTGTSSNGLVAGGPELARIVARHPQVARVVAGHVHRPIACAFAGTVGYSAPATCYAFGLDMGPERLLALTGEPPGLAVHAWLEDAGTGEPGLVTHTVPLGEFGAPVPLLRAGARVLPPEE